jgi:hypothetical protein
VRLSQRVRFSARDVPFSHGKFAGGVAAVGNRPSFGFRPAHHVDSEGDDVEIAGDSGSFARPPRLRTIDYTQRCVERLAGSRLIGFDQALEPTLAIPVGREGNPYARHRGASAPSGGRRRTSRRRKPAGVEKTPSPRAIPCPGERPDPSRMSSLCAEAVHRFILARRSGGVAGSLMNVWGPSSGPKESRCAYGLVPYE